MIMIKRDWPLPRKNQYRGLENFWTDTNALFFQPKENLSHLLRPQIFKIKLDCDFIYVVSNLHLYYTVFIKYKLKTHLLIPRDETCH